jgi:hypothetical protein
MHQNICAYSWKTNELRKNSEQKWKISEINKNISEKGDPKLVG